MEGIIIVNKPDGMTSHDVVAKIRRRFNMRRVGHAGTLDPLATGVLIVLLGKATKLFNKFVDFDKAYRATLILGTVTTSADTQGAVVQRLPYAHITRDQVEEAFRHFVGDIEQVPPMVSAVKMGGRKLYELARKGIEVERKPRPIRVDCLTVDIFNPPDVSFYVECSKGTYVRQLADDIGKFLGCGACISRIQRTKVGQFHIEDAVSIEEINESHIRDWEG
jgi:tRNA pseudouridine55 synthase